MRSSTPSIHPDQRSELSTEGKRIRSHAREGASDHEGVFQADLVDLAGKRRSSTVATPPPINTVPMNSKVARIS
jgi:hypothetical protein